MRYKVTIRIEDLENKDGRFTESERTVSVDFGKLNFHPHDPRPVDCDCRDRLIRWAINEAADEAMRSRR